MRLSTRTPDRLTILAAKSATTHGYDSGWLWTEGSHTDSVAIPSVPPGNYYLRVEPESDSGHGTISYSITAKRDVPQVEFLWDRAAGFAGARRR